MYANVEKELTQLLLRQTYAQLMNSKFTYDNGRQTILYKSMLVPGKLTQMDPTSCARAASAIVAEIAKSNGIREFGQRQPAKAELWNTQLCRGLGPVGTGRADGPWWFDAELVRRWERVYATEVPSKRRDKVMEAIRPMLAICNDWNDLLRLLTMTPGGGGIPVVTGQGRHQPIESSKSKHYDSSEKVVFIGGFQQVFVPFVPVGLVGPFA